MAFGNIHRDGTVNIQFDAQAESLAAPNGQIYLPCENCGRVQTVLPSTVAITCMPCVRQLVVDGKADPAWLADCEQQEQRDLDMLIPDVPEVTDF